MKGNGLLDYIKEYVNWSVKPGDITFVPLSGREQPSEDKSPLRVLCDNVSARGIILFGKGNFTIKMCGELEGVYFCRLTPWFNTEAFAKWLRGEEE